MSDRERPSVLVTGGASGIGRALALGLAEAGHPIAIAGDSGREDDMLVEFERRGVAGAAVRADFASRASTQQAFARAAQTLGPIHNVVHARISPEALEVRAFHELDDSSFDRQCEAEIRAALFAFQAAHALFTAQDESGPGSDALVLSASTDGATRPIGRLFGVVPTIALSGAAGHAAWSAACEGQRSMLKSAARQWGPQGILVHCIAPALDAFGSDPSVGETTDVASLSAIPLGHSADPEHEIAPLISLLTRDAARALTGQTLRMDGGVWLAG